MLAGADLVDADRPGLTVEAFEVDSVLDGHRRSDRLAAASGWWPAAPGMVWTGGVTVAAARMARSGRTSPAVMV
jgi:hypothetical protein